MSDWLRWLMGQDHGQLSVGTIDTNGHGSSTSPLNHLAVQRLVMLFLAIGLVARVVRYYLCFPLWDDESFLCVNLISRSYADLLRPLDYHQVAPVLFLWCERFAVRSLGFSEYALRLMPFVCSIASLFLFRRVASQLLSGTALVFAMAIFAVSYPGIRYAAEAKPYGTDMFLSLMMLGTVVEWQRTRDLRWLSLLAILMPLALGLSYPAAFAAGGLSLCVAAVLLTAQGTRREWIVWAVWNLSLVASFGLWFRLVGSVQGAAEGDFMGEYWKVNFPPMTRPWEVPFWILKTHASDFLAYPVGGPNWASSLTLVLCCAGACQLVAHRKWPWLGLIAGPAGLHFLAAALEKYPYGGHVKFSQYLAPMICCLAGVGVAQLIEWRSRWLARKLRANDFGILRLWGGKPRPPVADAVPVGANVSTNAQALLIPCGIMSLIGFASIGRDLINPYKTRSDFRARAFAESFWVGAHSAEEVACVKSDLGLDFVPKQHSELSWSAHYLCNKAIEESRWRLRPAKLERVTAERPLRCVLYRDARYDVDRERLEAWLTEMQRNYQLIARESIPFPRMAKNERTLITMEYVDSFRFIPRTGSEMDVVPLADESKQTLR